MKYSFKMEADDYTKAFFYKLKVCKLNDNAPAIAVFLCLVALICLTLVQKAYLGAIYFVLLLLSMLFVEQIKRKSVIKQFSMTPILSGVHTFCIYDEGLEVINGYEKIFTPWESIYHFNENDKRVIILPTFRKGVFVINKETADKAELDEFLTALKKHLIQKEG